MLCILEATFFLDMMVRVHYVRSDVPPLLGGVVAAIILLGSWLSYLWQSHGRAILTQRGRGWLEICSVLVYYAHIYALVHMLFHTCM